MKRDDSQEESPAAFKFQNTLIQNGPTIQGARLCFLNFSRHVVYKARLRYALCVRAFFLPPETHEKLSRVCKRTAYFAVAILPFRCRHRKNATSFNLAPFDVAFKMPLKKEETPVSLAHRLAPFPGDKLFNIAYVSNLVAAFSG